MGAVRIRYVGLLSDPNYGYGEYELFESLDRARLALENRYRHGWETSHEGATQRINLGGEREHEEFGVLTRQAVIEIWPLLDTYRREEVVEATMRKHVSIIVDTKPTHLVILGPQQGSKVIPTPIIRTPHPWQKARPNPITTTEGEAS